MTVISKYFGSSLSISVSCQSRHLTKSALSDYPVEAIVVPTIMNSLWDIAMTELGVSICRGGSRI